MTIRNLIVSDIFGRTEALDDLAGAFSAPTEVFTPYGSKYMAFKDEPEAYAYFSRHVTLEGYAESLLSKIESIDSPINLIGFSVGASAIWRLSDHPKCRHVTRAYGFYGSQIRNMAHIFPEFPISLIFPESERHFSVAELMTQLSGRENVSLRQVPYLHGFMNPHSANFNEAGYQQEMAALCERPSNP